MHTPSPSDRSTLQARLRQQPPAPSIGAAAHILSMRAMCVVDDTTGCWLWKGAHSTCRSKRHNSGPRVWARKKDGSGSCTASAGRIAWELAGFPLDPSEFVCRFTCMDLNCIHPLHACACTPAEKQALLVERGRFQKPGREVAMHAANLQRICSADVIREIERRTEQGEKTEAIATALGTSVAFVKRVRRGWHPLSRGRALAVPGSRIFNLAAAA